MKADRATCHYMNQRWPIFLRYLLKYGPINNKTTLVDITAWCRSGDRPTSGSMMAISLVTHTVAGLLQDNFMTMRQATIWRRICLANYRTQYCWIFMKFTGTDGNINTALSVTYQMDMPEFVSRRWITLSICSISPSMLLEGTENSKLSDYAQS